MDTRGELKRNLDDSAILKDTVTVPDGGYNIVRIHATNPGFWLLHCHIDWHAEIGMLVIVQVGEPHEMQKVPKHFPKCGHWKMEGYEEGGGETDGDKCPNSAGSFDGLTNCILYILTVILSLKSTQLM